MESLYWIRTASGELIPYKMTSYQKHYHSLNIMATPEEEWKNRTLIKSRGIGASVTTLIDFITYIVFGFESVTFPISSYSAPASNDLLKKATQIIRDTEEKNKVDLHCTCTATSIICEKTGSEIRAIPANGRAFRRFRSPAVFLDEFASVIHAEELHSGAKPVLSEGGQMTLASTVLSHQDEFMKLVEIAQKEDTSHLFNLVLFDPDKFNAALPFTSQKSPPIAPWIDLATVEKDRLENPDKILREYQGIPIDEGVKFYKMPILINSTMTEEEDIKRSQVVYPTEGYRVAGMDVASLQDYAALSEFTYFEGCWWQTYFDLQQIPLPELQEYADKYIELRKPLRFNLDCTGQGLQLSQFLRGKHKSRINPIHGKMQIDKQKVREFAAINARMMMLNGEVKLMRDERIINHLHSWDATLTKCDGRNHHGDGAISIEYALLPHDKIPKEKVKDRILKGAGAFGFGKRF